MHTAWVAPRYPVPITVIRGRGGASVLSFMEPSMGADDAVPDTARPRWLAGVGVTGPDRTAPAGQACPRTVTVAVPSAILFTPLVPPMVTVTVRVGSATGSALTVIGTDIY